MKALYRKILRLALGWLCIILGVMGFLLPIIQGWPFMVLGLYFLSRHFPWAQKILDKFRQWFPGLAHKMDSARDKSKELARRILGKIKI